METEEPKSKFLENLLFACLGAISAMVLGLGIYEDPGARTPASLNASNKQVEIELETFFELDPF